MHRTLKTNGGDLQRLLPIQRALTEIQHDVKEAREAVESVVDSDSALNAVPLAAPELVFPYEANRATSSHRVSAPVRNRTATSSLCRTPWLALQKFVCPGTCIVEVLTLKQKQQWRRCA